MSLRSDVPAVRARWTQQIVEATAHLRDDQRDRIARAAGRSRVARIEALDAFDWLPIDDHIGLLDALLAELGPTDFVAFYRQATVANLNSPLLKTIAATAARTFGRAALLRAMPRAWSFIVRGCGRLRVERDAGKGETAVTISQIPVLLQGSTTFRLGLAAILAGAVDFGGYVGRVKLDEGQYEGDSLCFRVTLVVEPENDPADGTCGGVTEAE